MDERVIFLRKKIDGENSIEGYAQRVAEATGAIIKVCPCHSTTLRGMLKNIKFAKYEIIKNAYKSCAFGNFSFTHKLIACLQIEPL